MGDIQSRVEGYMNQIAADHPQQIQHNLTQNLRVAKRMQKIAFLVSVGLMLIAGISAFGAAYFDSWLEVPFISLIAASSYLYANSLGNLRYMEGIVSQLERLNDRFGK